MFIRHKPAGYVIPQAISDKKMYSNWMKSIGRDQTQIKIREYANTDLSSLASIYRSSIEKIGRTRYSNDQVRVWSRYFSTDEKFEKWLLESEIFVATNNNEEVLGFSGLEKSQRISSLFVAPEVMRIGIGTELLKFSIAVATSRNSTFLTTEASEFSKPLFIKVGFQVLGIETNELAGVTIDRYPMRLTISATKRLSQSTPQYP